MNSKFKNEFIVWSVVAAVFAVLTLVAVNLDTIRKSPHLNVNRATELNSRPIHPEYLHQPGYSVVVAQ